MINWKQKKTLVERSHNKNRPYYLISKINKVIRLIPDARFSMKVFIERNNFFNGSIYHSLKFN